MSFFQRGFEGKKNSDQYLIPTQMQRLCREAKKGFVRFCEVINAFELKSKLYIFLRLFDVWLNIC